MLSRLSILSLTLLSHYRLHRTQALFLLLGLSLGVAMLLATLMVSSAAKTAFNQAQQTLAGQAVAYLRPIDGARSLPEQIYRDLRQQGVTDTLPMVEGRIRTSAGPLQIRGTDLFPLLNRSSAQHSSEPESLANLQNALQQSQNDAEAQSSDQGGNHLLQFSYPPYLMLTSRSYGDLQGFSDRQPLYLEDGSPLPELRVLEDTPGLGYSLLCDIRCAQQYLNLENRLTSILVTALTAEQETLIQQKFSQQADLVMADKNLKNSAFTDAFLLNLQAIGFLAFLVGCFIAFNAVRFAVLQRQQTVKQMRLSGATAREITFALLLELCVWAVLASVTGLLLAWLLSSLLLPGIGMTLEQLFFSENILADIAVSSWWTKALGLSLLATLIATLQPLLVLARQQPLTIDEVEHRLPPTTSVALLLVLTGCLFSFIPALQPESHWAGLAITTLWFIGGALLLPGALNLFYGWVTGIKALLRFPGLHWLLSDGRADHQRHNLSMTALTIAIAACIAVLTMVSSFRTAFTDYLDTTLPESIYLNLGQQPTTPVQQFLDQHSDVAVAYPFYMDNAQINGQPGIVRGMTDTPLRQNSVSLESITEQSPADLWQQFHQRQGILINQALALSYQVSPGDRIEVTINGETFSVRVLGIYFSYGSLVNAFVIDQQWLLALWPTLQTQRIGVFTTSEDKTETILSQLTEEFELDSDHYILPQAVKQLALSVFQQTFQATQLLSIVILLIAAMGVFCSCYIAQLDKLRQLALIHILGLSYNRIVALSLLQLMINASLACLIALPLGLVIAWACVHLVLKLAFGWYFDLAIDAVQLAQLLGGSLFIVLAGAVIPLYASSKRCDATRLASAE